MASSRPRKQFGQHWLRSEKVLQAIVAAAAVSRCDRILEIGPGTGVLTRQLMAQAAAVVAVEIDWDLCRKLVQQFAQADNFVLLQGDFLTLDWRAALEAQPGYSLGLPNKVVANIPYYITGPILERLLGTIANPSPCPFDSIVLLVQREVADRLYAKPGSRAFGALSVRVQYLAACERVCLVPASAFYPPPKVESAVVRLTPRPVLPAAEDPRLLNQLVTLGFSSKRKMLRNNLKGTIDRDHLTALMTALQIPDQARAEDLGVEQWVALSNTILKEKTNAPEA
ncbi:16S rRNA (adenine(1518)-N(6)/adenine(1519)-N(6))-dimethyltransferase RsmA [Pseudanabaena sp. FACHB-2040]|uniref:16S rRNA (adenine(1518)-N(6)/adenine(1519)-N(6))- dimethyltransferase RsmA n=1 Tax=Pseudanabaena sp. FACHB-2040 TaxID=2692859 RepID=UPI001684FCA9|nr:16S rRNA (adenine(1518)-N(6)/adenine(1519)-N(6))-dimethyltransferase RsmA [Pseudanabaena sp. FACHB-2040]